jgi:hypothetical protein
MAAKKQREKEAGRSERERERERRERMPVYFFPFYSTQDPQDPYLLVTPTFRQVIHPPLDTLRSVLQ